MYDYRKVIEVAIGEIGYHEKKSNKDLDSKTANSGDKNYTKYARDLDNKGFYNGKKNGYAWCDMFVDWCFMTAYGYEAMAKLTNQPAGSKSNYGAGCTYSRRYYQKMGRLFTSPKPGDQIFFYQGGDVGNNNSIAHTGIVEKVDSTYVYTIEGNTSNQVARRKYKLTDKKIAGYGRPKWDCDGIPETVEPTPTPTPEPVEPTKEYRKATETVEEKKIWNYLLKKIGNAYGVAGLMGNLKSESALRSCNLQNTYETKLHFTDAEYTKAVDNGSYKNFASDSAGYGLAQWTSSGRKKNLLQYAKDTNSSIGNLDMQLEFLIKELSSSYKSVYNVLKLAQSVREASDAVLTKYERPANQGESAQIKRATNGEKYYNKYVSGTADEGVLLKKGCKGEDVKQLQRFLIDAGYPLPQYGVDGDYGTETEKAVKQFQLDNGLPGSGKYDAKTQALLLKVTGQRVVVVTGGTVNTRVAPVNGKVYKVVKKGDRLPLVDTDKETGWYLVMVDGVAVWITNKYTKVEQM